MILNLKRSSNLLNFLIGSSVLFLYLSLCSANKGEDKERLFLYMRSGNVREKDRSYQIAKQFGIERYGNHLRIRSNGTASQHVINNDSTSGMENGMENQSSTNSSSVVETKIIVSAFMPLTTVTQEEIVPLPPKLPPPSSETVAKRPSSQSPKNSTSKSEQRTPAIVASPVIKENVTLESLPISLPVSTGSGPLKVAKVPTPDIQLLSQCGCKRNFYYSLDDFSGYKLNSSCSDEGTKYTAGQKVVSFSLPRATSPGDYNRTNVYKPNILENLHRMRHFYPGYSMRLYTDLQLDTTYCRFLCQNTDLFWCDIRNSIGDQSKMLHATWKFLPLGDPSVQLFLSRDISSLINEREAAVVEDWLSVGVNKTFHLMRDKRRLHNIAMLGGLWGARNDLLLGDEGEKLRAQIIPMSKAPRNKGYRLKNFDQDILSRVIFYPRKRDIVAYDSYHCKQWKKFTMIRPFPVKRNETILVEGRAGIRGSASSAVAAIKKKYKLTKCPIECRPSYGKDWDYC